MVITNAFVTYRRRTLLMHIQSRRNATNERQKWPLPNRELLHTPPRTSSPLLAAARPSTCCITSPCAAPPLTQFPILDVLYIFFLFFSPSGGLGITKLKLTTLPVFPYTTSQVNSIVFAIPRMPFVLAKFPAGLTVVISVPHHEIPYAGQVALGPVFERLVLLEYLFILSY